MNAQISDTKAQIPDKEKSTNYQGILDLEERMSTFGEKTITFCKNLQTDHISRPIVTQLIRSVTGIAANYLEANNGSSKKDFRNKVYIAKKEAQESRHWFRMLRSCYPEQKNELDRLWQEAHEITLILQSVANKINQKL